MSTDREVTRVVQSWLQEGRTTLPDHVLDHVLDRLPTTPQRRPFWPARRSNPMTTLRVMLATAAVIVVAVAAINLTSRPNVATEATPPPNSAPTPFPSPGPLSIARGGTGPLEPGRYIVTDTFPFRLAFTVATEWAIYEQTSRNFIAIYKDSFEPPNGKGVIIGIVDNVNADACDAGAGLLDPQVGPTARDFATAVASQPRTDASPISDVSLSGYLGSFVEFTTTGPESDCANMLSRWPTPVGDRWGLPNLHDRLWILDIDGVRLVIDAWDFPEASAADRAEIQALVDSIEID